MTSILPEILEPPMMATKGRSGSVEDLTEEVEFLLHQQAGGGLGNEVGDALSGGVGAMGAAEGVVDVEVAERGELRGELGSLASSSGWKRRFSSSRVWPDSSWRDISMRDIADAVGRECHVLREIEDLFEQQAQPRDQRAQAHRLHRLALGAAEVRAQDDLGLVTQGVLHGGRVSRMRVSSVIRPSFRGTLKSTRMSTRLLVISRSRIESLGIGTG